MGRISLCESRERPMAVAAHAGVAVIKPGQTYVGKQGFTYGAGASTETVGAQKVCMNVLPMPPGAVAKAHYHKAIETIAYMLEGECAVYWGDNLQHREVLRQGEQCFVAADIPHAPRNESGRPCTWIVVHSSGGDQDGLMLRYRIRIVRLFDLETGFFEPTK